MTMPPFATPESRARILLVEETSVLRELQVLLLRTAGYSVSLAERPAEALLHVRLACPDVVVINSDQPSVRDAGFLAELRYYAPNVRIAIMAALLTSDDVREFKRNGATSVLDRTLNPGLFVEMMDGVLDRNVMPGPGKVADTPASDRSLVTPAEPDARAGFLRPSTVGL